MKQVDSISIKELYDMASKMYDELAKAVDDVRSGCLVVDAEMHADEEKFLLEQGSM